MLGMQSVMQPIGYKTKNVALYRTVFTFFLICVATVTLLLASRTGVYRFGDISFVEMNFLFISNDSSVDFCPFAWQTNVLVTQKWRRSVKKYSDPNNYLVYAVEE